MVSMLVSAWCTNRDEQDHAYGDYSRAPRFLEGTQGHQEGRGGGGGMSGTEQMIDEDRQADRQRSGAQPGQADIVQRDDGRIPGVEDGHRGEPAHDTDEMAHQAVVGAG